MFFESAVLCVSGGFRGFAQVISGDLEGFMRVAGNVSGVSYSHRGFGWFAGALQEVAWNYMMRHWCVKGLR